MGNSLSSTMPSFDVNIRTKDGKPFRISYLDLVDHILLLRQVILHPEMTRDGPELQYFINDYCKRMAQEEMTTKDQQLELPWQVEWIWHVHRLHPLVYHNDCVKQLPNKDLVDKKVYNLIRNRKKSSPSQTIFTSIDHNFSFVPSINLTDAVLRQTDFLDKFQKHRYYSYAFKRTDRTQFRQLIQNYISFMKLARKNEMIVPTFDIDLIWHSHMRRPVHYQTVSTALCGFTLDHDDSIEQKTLSDNYQKTAERWKSTYNSNYGYDIDRKQLKRSQYVSSCAMVFVPIFVSSSDGSSSCGGGGDACGGCGGGCGGGDGGGGGGGCGGGDGGGGGGCGGGCGGGGGGCGGG